MKTIIRGFTLVSLIVLAAGASSAVQSVGRWALLGERQVDFKNDHDEIDVDRSEGRFKQIEIRVTNAPIQVSNVMVTFGNDETFKPNLRHRFAEGSGSHIIDLPGERRTIKRIDFNYRSINRRESKGMVAVLAR